MTVSLLGDATIVLEGICPVEDAEHLLRHLLDRPHATVDWRGCDDAHTAVIQVVTASDAKVIGPPRGVFLAKFIAPLVEDSETGRPLPRRL